MPFLDTIQSIVILLIVVSYFIYGVVLCARKRLASGIAKCSGLAMFTLARSSRFVFDPFEYEHYEIGNQMIAIATLVHPGWHSTIQIISITGVAILFVDILCDIRRCKNDIR